MTLRPRAHKTNEYRAVDETTLAIVIRSPKYGVFECLIDKEAYSICSQYMWSVGCGKSNRKVPTSRVRGSKPSKTIKLYRLITGFKWASVDHINGNPLDNRLCNLRETDASLNQANRIHHNLKRNLLEGVMVSRNRFGARLIFQNKPIWIGSFLTEVEAHQAYVAKHIELFGNHSKWSKK